MVGVQRNHNPLKQLDAVISETVAHIGDYVNNPSDFTRNRKLNAEKTIKVTLNMQGNSLNAELLDAFPDIDERMTASAYEQAKGKLKYEAFQHILTEYNKTMILPKRMDGYNVYAVDGCDFNIPYSPSSEYVVDHKTGRPKNDGTDTKPFSMVHANLLFDLNNRIYQDCELQPRTQMDERDACVKMLERLDNSKPFIIIADRGYSGFNFIEHLNRIDNCYYVIRTKAGNTAIREIADLPDEPYDREITLRITTSGQYYGQHKHEEPHLHHVIHINRHYKKEISKNTKDTRWDFEQFVNMTFRVVKFRINDEDTGKEEWEVLITNLNRFEFPMKRMKKLYHKRWDIETSFRELKYALGGISFHSKKDEFIRMELFAHFIMFNAVSRGIALIKVPQANHKYLYTIDFKMACLITRKYYRLHSNEPPDRIYAEMLSYTNPVREGRKDLRKVIRPKTAIWFVYRVA